jgi:SsrA-binding protein
MALAADILSASSATDTLFGENKIQNVHCIIRYGNLIISMNITNKKANYSYILEPEKIEAGLVLLGTEAKSLRCGRGDLSDSYAKIINDEVYLVNANIPCPNLTNYDSTRSRKVLLHRSEIVSLKSKIKAKKLTLVPVKLYTCGHLIKLSLCLGKSKHKFEKRETIKKKDIDRDIERELKQY